MMQFYKKRDFGAFITDSFTFFKLYGKNYFKNYILLNGLLLILMVAIFIFGYRELIMQIFGSNMSGESYYFESYFEDNIGMFVVIGLITFLLFLLMMIVNYLFPVFYLKRLAEGETKIRTDDILGDFKRNAGKIGKLCLGMIFIVTPLSLILMGISYVMIVIVVGIFLIVLVYPALFNVITFLMYDYFNSKRGFFESLSYSIRSQFSYTNGREKSPFWKYWGSTVVISIILYVITTIFTVIPMIFFMLKITTTAPDANFEQNPFAGSLGVMMFVMYGISLLVSFFLSNMLYVNSGLMYYDSRRDFHQKIELEEIETIGING
ncbi:DUF4013 domain-containing protein [Chryseobacterium indoltheticum]|uniref:DUF4013 domain-containing protein n=1 Tax=Chryseobacterium indoltheticum TaxID=254 RepID=A0A381F8X0_9FLAO|nr:DUF4013 domain-containing protein [Chryseobacterium indoltheticum]AZA72925.1 DUF4013 domain-containing protein [Chryseobacterium indoltheticum]SIP89348.1 Protein of unknown function [Chryseobacterium indoltheticum]SUX42532.1 Uncharacterised protein [Chryseobacterium indoltheticum]